MWKDVMPSPSFPPTVQWTADLGTQVNAASLTLLGASGAELGVTEFVWTRRRARAVRVLGRDGEEVRRSGSKPADARRNPPPRAPGRWPSPDAPAEIVTAVPAVDADEGCDHEMGDRESSVGTNGPADESRLVAGHRRRCRRQTRSARWRDRVGLRRC